ncbi:hypothetical protein QE152_g4584 [Popillia japonica]|uniref:Zinc finger PHD-type domain-containing protein n=1 Tax=Popillia japonica TaxID=7064 RepID=A0AAW1MYG7_POPJA
MPNHLPPKTGIYPINPDVFPDYIFQASETTNIVFDNIIQAALNVHIHNNAQPGPSSSSTTAQKNLQNPTSGALLLVTPADLSPVPVGPFVSGQGKRKSRKRQGTSVLNSTPNLEEAKVKETSRRSQKKETSVLNSTPNLEEAKEKRKPKLEVPEKRKRAVKRKVLEESESETDKEPFSADEEDDSACIYCTELYKFSKKGELWLCCCSCQKWAHAQCAGLDKKTKIFVCELCTD